MGMAGGEAPVAEMVDEPPAADGREGPAPLGLSLRLRRPPCWASMSSAASPGGTAQYGKVATTGPSARRTAGGYARRH